MNEDKYTTILECVVGSTLHGTHVSDGLEDLDLMAVVIEPQATFMGLAEIKRDTWTFRTKPEGVRSEAGDVDYTAYGLRKYLQLALKGNPTILLALFAPPQHTRLWTSYGAQLQALASSIVSKQVFPPFRGYMQQQKERLVGTRGQKNVTRPELIERYGYDTKYAAHIVRLGYQGIELLETGKLVLPMIEAKRQACVDIRLGKQPFDRVIQIIEAIDNELEATVKRSTLPDAPDRLTVEQWMINVYNEHWRILWQEQE